jgi:hypothetical protein
VVSPFYDKGFCQMSDLVCACTIKIKFLRLELFKFLIVRSSFDSTTNLKVLSF